MTPNQLHNFAVESYSTQFVGRLISKTPRECIHLTVSNEEGGYNYYVVKATEDEKGSFGAVSFSVWKKVLECQGTNNRVLFVIAHRTGETNISFTYTEYTDEDILLLITGSYYSTKLTTNKKAINSRLSKNPIEKKKYARRAFNNIKKTLQALDKIN